MFPCMFKKETLPSQIGISNLEARYSISFDVKMSLKVLKFLKKNYIATF